MTSSERHAAQLALLRGGPSYRVLDRPAVVGDGILRIEPDALHRAWDEARATGRLMCFVPASGAATRFVQGLSELGGEQALALAHVVEAVERAGGSDRLPKGLVPIHVYEHEVRTAFDEHLVEAAALAGDDRGVVRAHFTVGEEHRAAFALALDRARERAGDARLEVAFSVQDPETDTPFIEAATGEAMREPDGTLRRRPGGHGALLGNLQDAQGDILLIKNVDNVVPDRLRGEVLRWRRALVGYAATLDARIKDVLARGDAQAAEALLAELGIASVDALAALERPLRVCGMVPNSGQPGGGPFWVRDTGLQIVEGAEIDTGDARQAAILAGSTHFNPVEIVACLRDRHGRPFSLAGFADPEAVMVTNKVVDGTPCTVLELPGLWNGSMARWNTVFVEVPAATFQPVKKVDDLLTDAHRP